GAARTRSSLRPCFQRAEGFWKTSRKSCGEIAKPCRPASGRPGLDETLQKPWKTANNSNRAVDFARPDAKSYSDAERLVEGVACLYVLCFYRGLEGSHEAF